ncbi:hypothetical protein BRN41_04835, partial [Xanthomonas oryzae pv. oryzae]
MPFARAGLALLHALRGNFFVNSYVKPQWLTHDPARVESDRRDPLITAPISVRVLLGRYAAADRVVEDAQAITVPTQLRVSGADSVVHPARRTASTKTCARRSRSGFGCRGFSTTPWASAIVRLRLRRSASLCKRVLRSRRCVPRYAMRTVPAQVSKRPSGW